MSYVSICAVLWVLWWSVWLLVGITAKANKDRESFTSRLPHLLPLVGGGALIYSTLVLKPHFAIEWPTLWRNAGLAGIVFGLAFACWARVHLGRNWSGLVTLKEDHELVHSGPYKLVRHPIYTGILFAALCTAVSVSTVSAFVGVALWFLAFSIKACHEERMLYSAFGERYLWLCQAVPSIMIPGVY